jgi:signal transduction histidine kinase
VNRAVVSLSLDQEEISLSIEDTGKGFAPHQAQSLPGHMGLSSMQERIEALGGTLKIESSPGKGTRIHVDNLRVGESEYA